MYKQQKLNKKIKNNNNKVQQVIKLYSISINKKDIKSNAYNNKMQ